MQVHPLLSGAQNRSSANASAARRAESGALLPSSTLSGGSAFEDSFRTTALTTAAKNSALQSARLTPVVVDSAFSATEQPSMPQEEEWGAEDFQDAGADGDGNFQMMVDDFMQSPASAQAAAANLAAEEALKRRRRKKNKRKRASRSKALKPRV